jgi:ankyrin repeat protein
MTRFIVPKEAAVLNDPNAMSFALDDVNHANMNKFLGPDDHNYELTRDVIFGLVEHAYPFLLTQAILNGDAEYCQKIVSAHSDSFATNESLSDALRAAVTTSQSNILQMLLDANIRVNALLDDYGDTALILAVRSEASNRNVVVLQLLEKGADKDVLNANQKSAVDYAMDTNDVDLQRMLQDGPLLVGPVLKRATFDLISQPQMNIRDYNCTRNIYAKVADVYEVRDRERTFLRTPSVYDLIYEYGPRMLMNRERSKETEMGTKKFRWLHLPANNVRYSTSSVASAYSSSSCNG